MDLGGLTTSIRLLAWRGIGPYFKHQQVTETARPPVIPAPKPVILRLICRDPLAPQPEILVESFPVELGRGAEAAVRIDDRWLSRRHCRLDLVGGIVQVRDMASRHGTFVNGQPVRECQLLPGDELCIGLTHFVAEYEPQFAHADA